MKSSMLSFNDDVSREVQSELYPRQQQANGVEKWPLKKANVFFQLCLESFYAVN